MQEYYAIVINTASSEGLNGVMRQACGAGITCLFRWRSHEPCEWRIAVDSKQMGKHEVLYLPVKLRDGGNLLEIRYFASVFVDDEISAGIHQGAAETRKFETVGSVHGNWAQDMPRIAVAGILPGLPEIIGVVTQGGDGYRAAQAIAAASRDIPIIVIGNGCDALSWWKEQKDANG